MYISICINIATSQQERIQAKNRKTIKHKEHSQETVLSTISAYAYTTRKCVGIMCTYLDPIGPVFSNQIRQLYN